MTCMCDSPLPVFFLSRRSHSPSGHCYPRNLSAQHISCCSLLNELPWFAQSNNPSLLLSPLQREHAFPDQQWCRGCCRTSKRSPGPCEPRQRFQASPAALSGAQRAQHDHRLQRGEGRAGGWLQGQLTPSEVTGLAPALLDPSVAQQGQARQRKWDFFLSPAGACGDLCWSRVCHALISDVVFGLAGVSLLSKNCC